MSPRHDVIRGGAGASLATSVESKPRALLVSEVAELLSISGRQVYKLAAEHRIPYLRIAGSIRFDPSALASWLRRNVTCGGCEAKEPPAAAKRAAHFTSSETSMEDGTTLAKVKR